MSAAQNYPFLTPGRSTYVSIDMASEILSVKLEPKEQQYVEESEYAPLTLFVLWKS